VLLLRELDFDAQHITTMTRAKPIFGGVQCGHKIRGFARAHGALPGVYPIVPRQTKGTLMHRQVGWTIGVHAGKFRGGDREFLHGVSRSPGRSDIEAVTVAMASSVRILFDDGDVNASRWMPVERTVRVDQKRKENHDRRRRPMQFFQESDSRRMVRPP
jgi:hypothetical protein